MYTREQIIDEIKRVAKKIGGKFLKQTDFENHSTIPISTLKFYLGSWKRALDEAGLKSMQAPEMMPAENPNQKTTMTCCWTWFACMKIPVKCPAWH